MTTKKNYRKSQKQFEKSQGWVKKILFANPRTTYYCWCTGAAPRTSPSKSSCSISPTSSSAGLSRLT